MFALLLAFQAAFADDRAVLEAAVRSALTASTDQDRAALFTEASQTEGIARETTLRLRSAARVFATLAARDPTPAEELRTWLKGALSLDDWFASTTRLAAEAHAFPPTELGAPLRLRDGRDAEPVFRQYAALATSVTTCQVEFTRGQSFVVSAFVGGGYLHVPPPIDVPAVQVGGTLIFAADALQLSETGWPERMLQADRAEITSRLHEQRGDWVDRMGEVGRHGTGIEPESFDPASAVATSDDWNERLARALDLDARQQAAASTMYRPAARCPTQLIGL